jgi:endonuclease/exonuclease/phosphatase family metal-dependent hydrolase
MDAVFVPAHQFRRHCLGNAVLCREPIVETITHELPHSWPERRVLLEVRGSARGLPITIFCTHLVHMARMAARLRLAQTGAVAEQLRRCGQPHVLMGDLNAAPHSREMDPLRSATNGHEHLNGLRTWPATRPFVLYDHIWPGMGWKVESIEVLDDAVSDHRPLLAHLRWDGAPQIPIPPQAGT